MYRASSTQSHGLQRKCLDSEDDVLEAFGEEVHIFMQARLSEYDRTGQGLHKDGTFSDMYGSPMHQEQAWMEGYHLIELELFKHFHQRKDKDFDFPLIAGMAGGAYLYKIIGHDCEPWNWTGWVPRKKLWCTQNEFHLNRHFLHLRGNDIQNNLWDYHPHLGQLAHDHHDTYKQMTPLDKYKGGYWLKNDAWARYLHITCTKSYEKVLGICYRFNWIVSPLGYRYMTNSIPDNSLDGTQYSILNVKYDGHFNDPTKWGNDVHGLEVFNDLTYFASRWSKDDSIRIFNGQIMHNKGKDKDEKKYVYWFDTYPLEFGEFLLETSLERGVYYFAVAGNDVFTHRDFVSPDENLDEETRIIKEAGEIRLLSDPKGHMLKNKCVVPAPKSEESNSVHHLKGPYGDDTVFGHTTLIDTFKILKGIMDLDDPNACTLETAEMSTHNWLVEGSYFSHTGVYDIFDYGKTEEERNEQSIPFMIENQHVRTTLCYRMKNDKNIRNELIFYFPKCKDNGKNDKVVWKYTLQYIRKRGKNDEKDQFETVHGYFKLSTHRPTRLNLKDAYQKEDVKWIQFSALRMDNPQRRAWFNPIRGLAFGDPKPNENTAVGRINRVAILGSRDVYEEFEYDKPKKVHKMYTEYYEMVKEFNPHVCEPSYGTPTKLEFLLPPCAEKNADDLYVYNMQACGYQPEYNEDTKNSKLRDDKTISLPPQVLQNVTGYFKLNPEHHTKLKLSNQWDPSTVKENEVSFYCIDKVTFQPKRIEVEMTADMEKGYET